MNKFMKSLTGLAMLWLVAVLIIFPKECINSGLDGVFLCLDTVIPSLFPFFVCSKIITGLGMLRPLEKILSPVMRPLFGVSGKGSLPFVMGILSGYPVGASCVADLYARGECGKEECEKLLAFCNNSGPLFILGAVGTGMLNSPVLGRYLYLIHIISAIITGLIFKFYKTKTKGMAELPPTPQKDYIKVIVDAFESATENMLSVCGFVVFFCVFGGALRKMGISPIVHGLFEISGGVREISNMGVGLTMRIPWISAVIAFSGVSVILQVLNIVKDAKLSPKFYLLGKGIQGIIAFALTYFTLKFIPITKTTVNINLTQEPQSLWGASIATVLFILISLIILHKKAVDN